MKCLISQRATLFVWYVARCTTVQINHTALNGTSHGNVGRKATAITHENIEKAKKLFEQCNQNHCVTLLNNGKSALHNFVRNRMQLIPYKIQVNHPHRGQDTEIEFCQCHGWIENSKIDPNEIFLSKTGIVGPVFLDRTINTERYLKVARINTMNSAFGWVGSRIHV